MGKILAVLEGITVTSGFEIVDFLTEISEVSDVIVRLGDLIKALLHIQISYGFVSLAGTVCAFAGNGERFGMTEF